MLYLEGQFMFLTCTIVWKEPLAGTDPAAGRGGTENAAAPEGGAARERPGHETAEREGAALCGNVRPVLCFLWVLTE